jgi:hypothetical protein
LVLVVTLGSRANDRVILPLILGTPLYGTLFTTLGLFGPHQMPGEPSDIWLGASIWIAIYGGLAALLFWLTVATFDHCLGRIPEDDEAPRSGEWKQRRPMFERGPRSGTWKDRRPRFDAYFDDDLPSEPSPQPV